jgi:molecular chaperone DnaK (HSP70)
MKPFNDLLSAAAGKTSFRVIGIDLGTTNSTVAQVRLPVEADACALNSRRRWVLEHQPHLRRRSPEVMMWASCKSLHLTQLIGF